jgi:hypothetical protein
VVRCGAVRVGSVRWLVRGSVRPDSSLGFASPLAALVACPSVTTARRPSWLRYMCRCVALVTCRVAESDSERCMVYFIS